MTGRATVVVISGVGAISACGATGAAHLAALDGTGPKPDRAAFRPYSVYCAAPFDVAEAIPSKSDRRQMEPWQHLGVAAARQALGDAGLMDTAALDGLYLNICANGGAREVEVDFEVLADLRASPDPDADLVAAQARKLRPSFLLGQLSNMLAGNLAIILGVGGGARTFMGDDMAGVDAMADAIARVGHGQCDRIMVGGVLDAERPDLMLAHALGDRLASDAVPSVLDPARRGVVPGSVAAFLVLESARVAQDRAAGPLAGVSPVSVAAEGPALVDILGQVASGPSIDAIYTSVSGAQPVTADAVKGLRSAHPDTAVTATADLVGHAVEAAFPFAVALSALSVRSGRAGRVLATTACESGAAALVVEAMA